MVWHNCLSEIPKDQIMMARWLGQSMSKVLCGFPDMQWLILTVVRTQKKLSEEGQLVIWWQGHGCLLIHMGSEGWPAWCDSTDKLLQHKHLNIGDSQSPILRSGPGRLWECLTDQQWHKLCLIMRLFLLIPHRRMIKLWKYPSDAPLGFGNTSLVYPGLM